AAIEPDIPPNSDEYLGLAFSGGGIRSATFNLGILQALAKLKLLPRFDYLSTVSGGGYIGSWLTAWIHRQGIGKVNSALADSTLRACGAPEAPQIRWLRKYSNYLTPKLGLFSGDTWAAAGIYLRNTSLNLTVLVLVLSALLLVPYLASWLMAPRYEVATDQALTSNVFWAAMVLLSISFIFTIANLSDLTRAREDKAKRPFGAQPWLVQVAVIVPALTACCFFAMWMWSRRESAFGYQNWPNTDIFLRSGLASVSLWAISWALASLFRSAARWAHLQERARAATKPTEEEPGERILRMLWIITMAFPAGGVGGLLVAALMRILSDYSKSTTFFPAWHVGMWSATIVALGFLVIETLHIGLVGKAFSEDVREWWGRLGGFFILWVLVLSLVLMLSLDAPLLLSWLGAKGYLAAWGKKLAAAVWGAITGAGVYVGRSNDTGKGENPIKDLIARLAPAVFIIGLLVLLSVGVAHALPELTQAWFGPPGNSGTPIPTHPLSMPSLAGADVAPGPAYWLGVESALRWVLLLFFFALLVLALFLSWRVGINDFSMHAFYRNRLVRCYLGASRFENGDLSTRDQQPFTGFDPKDDFLLSNARYSATGCDSFTPTPLEMPPLARRLREYCVRVEQWIGAPEGSEPASAVKRVAKSACAGLKRLVDQPPREYASVFDGPLHIVNTALNLVGGKNLAWQQRKAASFVMTPLFSGYEFEGDSGCPPLSAFQPTYACGESGRGNPISLGMALSTSGAAASPNMGYHSSATLSFLMTIFNVRLGWWLPNPRHLGHWRQARLNWLPGLTYLLRELTGKTDEDAPKVYLSDGGHFENLGIYELVRRKCRYIVACDAGADPTMCFGDLGNAIEKCRADFGVDIEICVEPIRPLANGKSMWHCAVGKIRYDRAESGAPIGTLLYIKASLTGEEPTDVLRYAAAHPEFPHQPTSDQFFDESQFESYRMLGEHVATEVFEASGEPEMLQTEPLPSLFLDLRQHWLPPASAAAGAFTRHTSNYRTLLKEIREDEKLHFLDAQIWPEWPDLIAKDVRSSAFWKRAESQRLWLPETEDEIRAGFYACNRMIQLMEEVYTDLHMNDEWEHPDNRGWMNLFQHWSWSGMFSATYAISANLYGARFQKFCERRLDLHLGQAYVPPQDEWIVVPGEDMTLPLAQRLDAQRISTRLREVSAAHKAGLLNFWERDLVGTYLLFCSKEVPLLLAPLRVHRNSPDESACLCFTIGFALISLHPGAEGQSQANLKYVRVQNHLRKTGLARQCLKKLRDTLHASGYGLIVRDDGVSEKQIQQIQNALPPEHRLAPESARWEAVPRPAAVRYVRQLLKSLEPV
ncbi:MAG: patatin-like phospholipase family protein, partial [Acidobacteriales bacterium]|nr:patatin-like phospholipase family protein [Terriglobales bacterium]